MGTNRKPVCDFLLVINILYGTFSELARSLLFKFWTLCVFEGLGTTYDVHLGLIGKRVVDFLC